MANKKEIKKCVLCGCEIHGYGNNAQPIANGVCCDDCNESVIIHRFGIASIGRMSQTKKNELRKNLAENMQTVRVGSTVLIYEMVGEPNYSGKSGIVEHIDDIGQIHGTWGGCALQAERDTFVVFNHLHLGGK